MISASDLANRAELSNGGGDLSTRQRTVMLVVTQYYQATGEPCSAAYVARRLDLGRSTVREHLSALYRKGWLRGPNPPAVPVRFVR